MPEHAAVETSAYSHSWVAIVAALLGCTAAVILLVAGKTVLEMADAWQTAVTLIPLLIPAAMLGLALTRFTSLRPLFQQEPDDIARGSPYPHAFRLIVSLALGFGTLALATLGLGYVDMLAPGGMAWPPLLLLAVACIAGFPATREFVRQTPLLRLGTARRGHWLMLAASVPLAVLLMATTYPASILWSTEAHGYDVLEYHLELPREYIANNSAAPVGHNVYSYLPANVEMLYTLQTQLAKSIGETDSYIAGMFPCQLLHALLMLLAAAAVTIAPWPLLENRKRLGWPVGRLAAGVTMLALPWVLVTGSLAYNEGGMMLFGVLGLAFAGVAARRPEAEKEGSAEAIESHGSRGAVILCGVFLGLAVGCKMTAGVFFALPAVFWLLLSGFRASWGRILAATIIAVAVYSPWAIRAAIASGGNPVFPIATQVLGRGSWTNAQAARFRRGHGPPADEASAGGRFGALFRESVLDTQWSPGLAAWQRTLTTIDGGGIRDIAPGGWTHVGVLWLLMIVAIAAALIGPGERRNWRAVVVLIGVLIIQVAAWMLWTHLQARFLLPIAVPLALLVGVGVASAGTAMVWLLGILIVTQACGTAAVFIPEAGLWGGIVQNGNPDQRAAAIGKSFGMRVNMDALVTGRVPPDPEHVSGAVLLVAPSTPYLIMGRVVYFTAFDRNALGDALRAGGPAGAVQWMRRLGIRYVWIDAREIERLRQTYGLDPAITPGLADALKAAGLRQAPVDLGPEVSVLLVPTGQVRPAGGRTGRNH